ncbi:hypothetical protein KSP39_PZI007918 [Platanthera zijinensis]|uniref:NADH:quinone oxidoreductase/Mrp antiporter transmembrane domain-containing protein n=1 Tax=Platanthera zijinensis TaxID=2320716 RepID=A0AAP0BPM9_9ASPA
MAKTLFAFKTESSKKIKERIASPPRRPTDSKSSKSRSFDSCPSGYPSWACDCLRGEIELQEIVNGLINTQMYNSQGISIALISITIGIGFKLSPTPFHQWTHNVYEGV